MTACLSTFSFSNIPNFIKENLCFYIARKPAFTTDIYLKKLEELKT